MPKCHHHHHADHSPDKWTTIAAVGEGVASFISDAYWLATLFDIVSGLEEDIIGLSYYAVGVGAVLAFFSAGGAAYSHRALNIYHQPATHGDSSESSECSHSTEEAQEPSRCHKVFVTLQVLALVGDFISHTGDIAGPITFVVNLATSNGLPRWGKGLVQCGASLFGGVSSVANVRTCKDAMFSQQVMQTDESTHLQQL